VIIENVSVGGSSPCRFVAEISNAHNGQFERALKLITAAKNAGADFIKFQCYTPNELIALRGNDPPPEPWASQGWTMRTLYGKAQTPLEWFPELFDYARAIRLVPFSSVFGNDSLAVLESVNCPVYKVAKLDNAHTWLVNACLKTDKKVIVSSEKAIESYVTPNVYNLYCPGSYSECGPDDIRLPRDFASTGYLGLSSHCVEPELAIAAVVRGAKMLEYHFQLDDEPSELEESVSLYAEDFKEMVRSVRTVEAMLS
jgi:pseudaminic acid synthase